MDDGDGDGCGDFGVDAGAVGTAPQAKSSDERPAEVAPDDSPPSTVLGGDELSVKGAAGPRPTKRRRSRRAEAGSKKGGRK